MLQIPAWVGEPWSDAASKLSIRKNQKRQWGVYPDFGEWLYKTRGQIFIKKTGKAFTFNTEIDLKIKTIEPYF